MTMNIFGNEAFWQSVVSLIKSNNLFNAPREPRVLPVLVHFGRHRKETYEMALPSGSSSFRNTGQVFLILYRKNVPFL